MDARGKANLKFLVLSGLLLIVLVTTCVGQARGDLYVLPKLGRCTETVLPLQLDRIKPLPPEVLFYVKRRDNEKVLVTQLLTLNNGTYTWTGLLVPLGIYKAQLFDSKDKNTLLGEYAFNNIDILQDFIEQERGEITIISRGGGANSNTNSERKTLKIDNLPSSTGRNQLHIVVINSHGNKADEYLGPPPVSHLWESRPLLAGQYRFVVVEYKGDGNCQIVRGG